MRLHYAAIALVGFALGARRLFSLWNRRTARQPDPLQTWESEGGAVPVAPNRTAAQVETS
jgi:hypothetical protein